MNTTSTILIEDKSIVPAEFDKIAYRYDLATYFSRGYMDDMRESAKRLNLKGDEKLLDLCCGTGKSTLACIEQLTTGTIIGVDNSIEMLTVAKSKFKEYGSRVQFEQQDAMHLTFEENSFDVIFMAYGIRNMPDYELCLQNLKRILKPGGKICFHEYSLADNFYSRPAWIILGYLFLIPFCTLLSGNFTIFHYLVKSVLAFPNPKQFSAMLTKNGFSQVSATPLLEWRRPFMHTFIAVK